MRQVYRGANYLEVDIDVAENFTYLSQRGICWALGLCDKLNADVAFVVEVSRPFPIIIGGRMGQWAVWCAGSEIVCLPEVLFAWRAYDFV